MKEENKSKSLRQDYLIDCYNNGVKPVPSPEVLLSEESKRMSERIMRRGGAKFPLPNKRRTLKAPIISLEDLGDLLVAQGKIKRWRYGGIWDYVDDHYPDAFKGDIKGFLKSTKYVASTLLRNNHIREYTSLKKGNSSSIAMSKLRKAHKDEFREILKRVRAHPEDFMLKPEPKVDSKLGYHIVDMQDD